MKKNTGPASPGKNRMRRGSAFTLIEIMVVCTIISILMSIILAVVGQVREKAQSVTCISNLRQVGLAIQMYVQDYDERYPPYFDFAYGDRCKGGVFLGGGRKYWPELILPYTKSAASTRSPVTNQARIEDLGSLFICPLHTGEKKQPSNYQLGNISSYGISDHIVNWWTPTGCGEFFPRGLMEVIAPSECLLLVETWDWFSELRNLPGAALALSPLSKYPAPVSAVVISLAGRHSASKRKKSPYDSADRDALNTVLFCDGHVRAIKVAKLQDSARIWTISNTDKWP